MALTTAGRDIICGLIIADGATSYANANARLGVGDSTTAFSAAHTDLQGTTDPTNKFRRVMEATFPSRATNVLTFKSSFGSTEANFAWAEWGIFNAAAGSGTMLSRKVEALGTKGSGSTWVLTATLTLTV